MPETRSRLGAYRRPSDSVLDNLTNPVGTPGPSDTADTRVTKSNQGTSDTQVNRGTSRRRESSKPRDHVKIDRELAQQMRNAVWFLAEHGRPRVQLGELIDEAVTEWLTKMEVEHNGGQAFPDRGRLR